jgi:serine/threonine protein kinase/tetratricopeptide (TPR) repeat protein
MFRAEHQPSMNDVGARLQAALADRYRIERELGAGGMAVVYLAHDLRHDRPVALKVLRPELLAAIGTDRFLQEIRLTANLHHSHILPLHDSGEAGGLLYYVMPFVEGESLRTRLEREKQLPIDQAVDFTRQMAGALDYAHRHGVVHRDLKPENVLIHEGQALVADFGIARAVSQAGGSRLTESGMSLGTPHYMSPEQALGEPDIDGRSDVYSLGCVLYEMLAGDPPCSGSTAQAITARKLTGDLPSVRAVREGVSPALERTIFKSLARVPADRFRTMSAFADALAHDGDEPAISRVSRRRIPRAAVVAMLLVVGVAAALFALRGRLASLFVSPPRYARVAILALENRTGDSTRNYLVDGISEALISNLARMEKVDVISLASVINYRQAPKPVDSIARELGVNAVVAGSLERTGDRYRVQVQLTAPGQPSLAAHTFESAADQLEGLEHDVARALAHDIGGRLTVSDKSASSNRSGANAHDLYLKGRYNLNSRTPEGLQNALDYFRQVLALDPANAPAYAGLAQYYSALPFYTNTVPAEEFRKAKTAALKAVELDPFLAEAHYALGYVLAYSEWDWAGAERSYRRALALQPSNADVHHVLSRLLAARGRLPEAVAEAERSHELDPLSLVAHANIGIIAYFGRDYAEAQHRLSATLEIDRQFGTAIWGLGLVHEQLGQFDQAIADFQKAMEINGRGTNGLASFAHALCLAGRRAEAEQILKEVLERTRTRPFLAYQVALILVGLGRNDEAMDWLERAYEQRSTLLSYIDRDPRLDPLRSSPRFSALLSQMHLAP